eukprot:713475-Pelagomonas_calceolata.AAC.5
MDVHGVHWINKNFSIDVPCAFQEDIALRGYAIPYSAVSGVHPNHECRALRWQDPSDVSLHQNLAHFVGLPVRHLCLITPSSTGWGPALFRGFRGRTSVSLFPRTPTLVPQQDMLCTHAFAPPFWVQTR